MGCSSKTTGEHEGEVSVVVLDAMGVIYRAGDDVAELLVPFVRKHGKVHDASEIERLYTLASRGGMRAFELWNQLGVDPALEDDYLEQHALTDGLIEFLGAVTGRGYRIACLSNDVSEWSIKLRSRFGLDAHVDSWVISGDVGARKPERAIYDLLQAKLGIPLSTTLFFDDRPKNLRAAAACGMRTVLVGSEASPESWPRVLRLLDALELLPPLTSAARYSAT